ncbi:MAG: TM0106 family RecB-like putative nuclease [Planctomycetota bacterium]|nr:TM0106 family RecB-like putative nuclease [Planctomycetota bacterium]
MSQPITASMLYDLLACPHRVSMDLFGDPALRDPVNPFVQMLWERGTQYERQVIDVLDVPFLDLSGYESEEKSRLTMEAMQRGEPLIYSGRIHTDDLLGIPDLLRKEGSGYVAGDIKSGSGEEGPEELSKPKSHYAVQLALYTDILERIGRSSERRGFIWDIHGKELEYDFTEVIGSRNPHTLWDEYQEALSEARGILARTNRTLAAYGGVCKMCHWYTACTSGLKESGDLTLIPELGRSKRDAMLSHLSTVSDFADSNPDHFIAGKKTVFPGVGIDMLRRLHERAVLLAQGDAAKPYLRKSVSLPPARTELFFDIEVDPMRDVCYLHGFVERIGGQNDTERFVYFFAEEPNAEGERQAFHDAWRYMGDRQPCKVYYYSKYERTIYRKLQEKYPDVCSADDIEWMFDQQNSIDLYFDVVKSSTEWPTNDHSIKTLAKYLGFDWRDTHPSGAASIQWFDEWINTGDPSIKQRILDYNEDDCRATRWLLDGIRALERR